jgi:hypothetical protein
MGTLFFCFIRINYLESGKASQFKISLAKMTRSMRMHISGQAEANQILTDPAGGFAVEIQAYNWPLRVDGRTLPIWEKVLHTLPGWPFVRLSCNSPWAMRTKTIIR